MASPISFEQFKSNPISAIAFVALLSVGFLFYELRDTHDTQLKNQELRIEKLEKKIENYENKLEEVNIKLIECLGVSSTR